MSKRGSLAKRAFLVLVLAMATSSIAVQVAGLPNTLPTTPIRQSVCLNGTWNFTPTGAAATQILVPATWREAAANTFYNFTYPGTWMQGGTYSHSLSVPSNMAGMVQTLAFGAVHYVAEVDVNGTVAVSDTDGFLPFECKLNGLLTGTNDVFTVKVDPRQSGPIGLNDPNGYSVSRGIWQDVYLKGYPLLYVDNTFFVKTSFRNQQINVEVPVVNADTKSHTFYVRNFVTDLNNNIVLTFDQDAQTLAAGASQTYKFGNAWTNPHYWIPEDPYLYVIHTVVYDSDKTTVIDWKQTKFGFREFYLIEPNFYLNGNKAYLRGDSHHYHGEYQQTKAYFQALFSAMKSWGSNYYRPHTLPYDPVMYEVADSIGMMIIAETAIYGSDGDMDCAGQFLDHLTRFIQRDRNHPSIVLWSCSNEVLWKNIASGNPDPRRVLASQLDSTRVPYYEENGCDEAQVVSIHYYDFDHNGAYATLPTAPVTNANKVQTMGEYLNYMYPYFGYGPGTADSGTGPCGYEVISQDYGSGMWTTGEMALGQTKGLQAQRLYGSYCPWSIYWFNCRTQPFFGMAKHTVTWPDLTAPGAKPQVITPCEHTINYLDPDLPTYVPYPSFYLFTCYYRPVRCTDLMVDAPATAKNCNFYSGSTITRNFDLWYESFRPANHMKTEIVRKSDGTVLATTDNTGTPWSNIQSGTTYTGLTATWTAPSVTDQTPVSINRTFYNGATAVNTCTLDGNIYPQFTAANIAGLTGKKLCLYDPAGATKTILDKIGITYTAVTDLSTVTSAACDVLVIGAGNPTTGLPAAFVTGGGRVLCLSQTTKPSLPINLPALIAGGQKDVQFLLNGAKHKIFQGLNQNDLSYWAGNVNTAANVYDRPGTAENIRVLLAANNDGAYAPILEVAAGKGTYLLSQMEIVPQYNNEPVAGKLLVNMLNYLGYYKPAAKAKTGLIASAGAVKTYYDGLGLRYDALTAGSLPADLTPYSLLIVDGSDAAIATSLSAAATVSALNTFVTGGGKVEICQITSGTMPSYSQIMSQFTLTLSTPTEKTRCVKCAASWLRKSSPQDLVRYAFINIPNCFEMNPDPLLTGISNQDLDWTATELNNGVKASGKAYPVVNELIAPYRIDWTTMEADHGEQTWPVNRSTMQNTWFVNRTPVLLKLNQGTGFWLINEILLQNDAVKGNRVGNLLLTSLGASVGSTDTYYNLDSSFTGTLFSGGHLPFGYTAEAMAVALNRVYRCPLDRTIRVEYSLPQNSQDIASVQVRLFNFAGRQVASEVVQSGLQSGKNTVALGRNARLSSGMYFVKMSVKYVNSGKTEQFSKQVPML